jgi:hypothetical protein
VTARAAAKAVERAKDDHRRRGLVEALRKAPPEAPRPCVRCGDADDRACQCAFDRMGGDLVVTFANGVKLLIPRPPSLGRGAM